MAFFQEATKGNQGLIDILVCFCNATLKGRADLQRFLYLIGLGGTGKGTFIRLLLNLIGMSNACSSDLDDFCNNRFEAARLSVSAWSFADTDKQVGKLGKFSPLVQTPLRSEEKNKRGFEFKYGGMVVVASNEPVFAGSSASRVKRCLRPFNNQVQLSRNATTSMISLLPNSH